MTRVAIIIVVTATLWCLVRSNNVRKKGEGFLLFVPKTLETGRNQTFCVSLHQAALPAKITVELKLRDKREVISKQLDLDTYSCFQIVISWKKSKHPEQLSVRATAHVNGATYTAHNQDPILLYPGESTKTFVHTDRVVYKPGDAVKFLIMQLNGDLLPRSNTKITSVRIKNPMGIAVMAWQNLNLDRGLISLDYQLVQEAMDGKWQVIVDNATSKWFEVAKYTVPRFNIDLKYPKAVYYRAEGFDVLVCGRYSYNKPVAGLAFVKVSDSLGNMRPVNKLSETINGCSEFHIEKNELSLDRLNEKSYDAKGYIHITATITEYGTNKMDVATGKSKIVLKAYNLKFSDGQLVIPGVPYQGQVRLTSGAVASNFQGELIEICYNLAIKKSWNYFNNDQCRNFSVAATGVVPFTLWPLKSSVIHVHLNARSVNNSLITAKHMLIRLYSVSTSFIQLDKVELSSGTGDACNAQHRWKITYSSDNFSDGDRIVFYYTLRTSRGTLSGSKYVHTVHQMVPDHFNDKNLYLGQMHKYVKFHTTTDYFYLDFNIVDKFTLKYHLLVYYVTKEGETVAGTKWEQVEPCSLKVASYWNDKQIAPGALATLHIQTTSPALCAVSATDKATSKFIQANQVNFNLEKVIKEVNPEREHLRSSRNGCLSVNNGRKSVEATMQRTKRHVYSFAEDFDAYDIFSKFGTVIITNLQLISKPCYNGPLVNESYQAVESLIDHNEEAPAVNIRSSFPENWLWELVPVTGSVQLQRTTPHSITNWVTNVFCASESDGIGFAAETELSSFQPFFVDVLTPFSIKKGEHFSLLVHVSNYMEHSLPIKMSIRLSTNLQLTAQMSATFCLKANGTQTQNYPIMGAAIGTANVTVLVENESQFPSDCGPSTIRPKRDVVFKTFQIESEGYFMSSTKSALLCASQDGFPSNISWNMSVPKHVEGTDKVILTVNADLLGHTVENLHQLLTIPTGCGEQIMASMAPNIYILKYLSATNGLTSVLKQRIYRNLKMGYQRILNYAHFDGSFSAFGNYDPSGSMFLTTFVVKVLQESKAFIYVDQRVIERAVKWIFSHQLENGCFDTMHHVFQDMGGTDMENSTVGLTSYVISSLFEAEVNVPDTVQTHAKYCIRSQQNLDKYSLVISSYALFKVYWIAEADRLLVKALAVANRENNLLWWSSRGDASDIEITSYALLAVMERKTAENMATAHLIVQWLVGKMGPSGAFRSTQDTIVALDALTKYAQFMNNNSKTIIDLIVTLEGSEGSQIFALRNSDKLKSKQTVLRSQDGAAVELSLSGTGCALMQLTLSYYTIEQPQSEAFTLAVEVAPVSNIDRCSIKSVSPCLAYEGPQNSSNMAVMEMALPSGFVADRASLYKLLTQDHIKMFEEKEDQVTFYFTNLNRAPKCFSFHIQEDLQVVNRRESVIKLYDYYQPQQGILQFYQVQNNCSRSTIEKEELLAKNCVYWGPNDADRNLISYSLDKNQSWKGTLTDIPECVHVPMANQRAKREAGGTKGSFLDILMVKPAAPTCLNVSFNARNETVRLKYKRDLPPGLNRGFVDLDVDMETPDCVNIPFYAPLPAAAEKNITSRVRAVYYNK